MTIYNEMHTCVRIYIFEFWGFHEVWATLYDFSGRWRKPFKPRIKPERADHTRLPTASSPADVSSPAAGSYGVSAQIGSGVVRGSFQGF